MDKFYMGFKIKMTIYQILGKVVSFIDFYLRISSIIIKIIHISWLSTIFPLPKIPDREHLRLLCSVRILPMEELWTRDLELDDLLTKTI